MKSLAETWRRDGYFVVRNMIDEERALRLKTICEEVFKQWRQHDPLTGQPGGEADSVSMRCLHHPDYFTEEGPLGHEDLIELLEMAADAKLLSLWREIFGENTHFRGMNFFINPDPSRIRQRSRMYQTR